MVAFSLKYTYLLFKEDVVGVCGMSVAVASLSSNSNRGSLLPSYAVGVESNMETNMFSVESIDGREFFIK